MNERFSKRERKEVKCWLRLSNLMREWVKSHPDPDRQTMYFGDPEPYSPRQLYDEVVNGTKMGRTIGVILFEAAREYKLTVAQIIGISIEANKQL